MPIPPPPPRQPTEPDRRRSSTIAENVAKVLAWIALRQLLGDLLDRNDDIPG